MQYLACKNVRCAAVGDVIWRAFRIANPEARCVECGEIMDTVDYRAMESEPFRSPGRAA